MDIDVKDGLNRILAVGRGIKIDETRQFEDILTADVYRFINNISIRDAEDRFNYFSKVYLGGTVKSEELSGISIDEIPETLKLICRVSTGRGSTEEVSKEIAAFFTSLGRHYMSSSHDRKDIDVSRFMELINNINGYIERSSEDRNQANDNVIRRKEPIATARSDQENSQVSIEEKETDQNEKEPEKSLEDLLDELNSLIGLDGVKKEVNQIINLIKVRKKGEEFGEKLPPLSLHLVFYGNPGTGKTTVARLLAKIYKSLGVLSRGQLVETDRGGLVAGYVGQTATKTQEKIDAAMGGILFIDEAYTLTHGKGETDFGQESVDTILKAMEDNRNDFIVIVAGYPDLMKEFIASNPGLKSRFNQFINFEDYTPSELQDIFDLLCKGQNLILTGDCEEYLKAYFENLYENRSEDYANGRDVRNYFEKVIRARANRLASGDMNAITREEYLTVTLEDLKAAASDNRKI